MDGVAHVLETLIPPGAGWDLRRALAINNGGQIVALGFRAGHAGERAALLTPRSSRSGDLDGDGDVDFADLSTLLAAWGPCPMPPASCPADIDGDGLVSFSDLLIVLSGWSR